METITKRNPMPMMYGHHKYPQYRSPRITHTKPRPMMRKVVIPTRIPNQFISLDPGSSGVLQEKTERLVEHDGASQLSSPWNNSRGCAHAVDFSGLPVH